MPSPSPAAAAEVAAAPAGPPARRLILPIAVALVIVLVAVIALWRAAASHRPAPVSLASLHWMFYREDLGRIALMAPGLIGRTLAGPGTYVLERSAGGTLPPGAIPTQVFFSATDLRTAIRDGTVIPGVRAVLDDPEYWPATSPAEQRDPVPAMRRFAQAARSGGYQPILAPGRDLTEAPGAGCAKTQAQTLTLSYLNCGIPAAARRASVFVIQSAPVETRLGQLVLLVSRAAAQARAANPHVIVLATLSTTVGTRPVGPAMLATAARAMLPYVRGFLVNTTPATDGRLISCLRLLASGS
ncbi:MAG TPA: hypothetical protein VLX31_10140 [Streptosporangiaceae bacterium]|nr:hypothetical protein [Streptosporangiaceae bacterium]